MPNYCLLYTPIIYVLAICNNIGHPSLENNFKNEPVQTIKINT